MKTKHVDKLEHRQENGVAYTPENPSKLGASRLASLLSLVVSLGLSLLAFSCAEWEPVGDEGQRCDNHGGCWEGLECCADNVCREECTVADDDDTDDDDNDDDVESTIPNRPNGCETTDVVRDCSDSTGFCAVSSNCFLMGSLSTMSQEDETPHWVKLTTGYG